MLPDPTTPSDDDTVTPADNNFNDPTNQTNTNNTNGNTTGNNTNPAINNTPVAQSTPATPAQTAGAHNTNAPAPVATASNKVYSGRHGFMGGMWSFFRFMSGHDTTTAQAKDSDIPEGTDSK